MARRIAAITIGQAPRPDLLEPLVARLPAGVEIIEEGALDGLTAIDIAALAGRPRGSYPLTTRMRDGSPVTLDEAALTPLVQSAITRAERTGAEVTLLLCAGGFLDVRADGLLVRPSGAAVEQLRSLGTRRVAVVVPFEGQAAPAMRKWADAGFEPVPIVGEPATMLLPSSAVDAIVIDYVGHSAEDVAALRARTRLQVVDLGECGAEAAVRHLRQDQAASATGAR